MIQTFEISTQDRFQLVDITQNIQEIVKKEDCSLASVSLPHSTAAILVTENEENLKKDWLNFLKDQVDGKTFHHDKLDDNADSHLLSGLIGQQKTFIVKENKLLLGTWQQIFLVELDGPRQRKVVVKLVE